MTRLLILFCVLAFMASLFLGCEEATTSQTEERVKENSTIESVSPVRESPRVVTRDWGSRQDGCVPINDTDGFDDHIYMQTILTMDQFLKRNIEGFSAIFQAIKNSDPSFAEQIGDVIKGTRVLITTDRYRDKVGHDVLFVHHAFNSPTLLSCYEDVLAIDPIKFIHMTGAEKRAFAIDALIERIPGIKINSLTNRRTVWGDDFNYRIFNPNRTERPMAFGYGMRISVFTDVLLRYVERGEKIPSDVFKAAFEPQIWANLDIDGK